MARTTKQTFSKNYNTKSRREYLDYDYLERLSKEEQEWLAKFSDEYYAASFKINPTFVKTKDCLKIIKKEIKKELNPKKLDKLKTQLELYKELKDEKFVQISDNTDKNLNLDLRKFRSTKKYYQNLDGDLVADAKLKYDSANIHDNTELRTKCNHNVNSNQRDIMSIGIVKSCQVDSGVDLLIENEMSQEPDVEDLMLLEEEIKERMRMDRVLREK